MQYTKQLKPPMVVAGDKVEKFLAHKPDKTEKEKRKALVATFREKNQKNR